MIFLVDVNLDNAQKAAKLISERFPNIEAVPFKADVSKEAEVEASVALAVKEFGRLDVMVSYSERMQCFQISLKRVCPF